MKNGQDNWADIVKNTASGYGAVVLAVICFVLVLVVVMALVRIIVGVGAGA